MVNINVRFIISYIIDIIKIFGNKIIKNFNYIFSDCSNYKFKDRRNKFILNLKSILFLFFFFNSLNIVFSIDTIYSNDYIKLNIEHSMEFRINFETKYNVNNFYLKSYFLPDTINSSQYLNKFTTTNNDYIIETENGSKLIKYNYNNDNLFRNNFINEKFQIESLRYFPKIKNKIKYPLVKINSDYYKYLKFYNLINIDEDIRKQASILAYGEDDVYVIASKIAKWIRNDINYDLKTALENPNQKSTEVFRSKSGVCKEITNLYISMIRSLGIPARVVSGYAYTDSKELVSYLGSNWGAHAWAEVLIGDIWVPFDLTYNEYGYIDATHIITFRSPMSKNDNIQLGGSGYGFNIVKNSLNYSSNFKIIDSKKYPNKNLFTIKLSGPKEIGFGSYGYIKVDVKNNMNYYQTIFLTLVKTKEVGIIGDDKKMLILEPNEEKHFYFEYKLPDNLERNYEYTFPFSIYNKFVEKNFTLKSKEDYDVIKKIDIPKENEEKKYSGNKLLIGCNFEILENFNSIICSVRNPNNYNIKNIKLCLDSKEKESNCSFLDLGLNEEKKVKFDLDKFSGDIKYSYFYLCNDSLSCVESGEFKYNIPKPILKFNFNESNYVFNYSIYNYSKDVNVLIYFDNNLINKFNSKYGQYVLNLNEGKHKLKIELKLKNQIIQLNEINLNLDKISKYYIEVLKQKLENPNKKLTFWDKLIIWLKNFFTYQG